MTKSAHTTTVEVLFNDLIKKEGNEFIDNTPLAKVCYDLCYIMVGRVEGSPYAVGSGLVDMYRLSLDVAHLSLDVVTTEELIDILYKSKAVFKICANFSENEEEFSFDMLMKFNKLLLEAER